MGFDPLALYAFLLGPRLLPKRRVWTMDKVQKNKKKIMSVRIHNLS